MMTRTLRGAVAAVSILFAGAALAAEPPAVGSPAPEFRLQDQTGKWHALSDYRGKWLVLYFYPKDNTPGCTTQACEFRDNIFAYRDMVLSQRDTFIIDPEGRIAKHYVKVDPKGHSEAVLADLKQLMAGAAKKS